jgi:hypothetical protein
MQSTVPSQEPSARVLPRDQRRHDYQFRSKVADALEIMQLPCGINCTPYQREIRIVSPGCLLVDPTGMPDQKGYPNEVYDTEEFSLHLDPEALASGLYRVIGPTVKLCWVTPKREVVETYSFRKKRNGS